MRRGKYTLYIIATVAVAMDTANATTVTTVAEPFICIMFYSHVRREIITQKSRAGSFAANWDIRHVGFMPVFPSYFDVNSVYPRKVRNNFMQGMLLLQR